MNLPNGWLTEPEAEYLAHLARDVAELEGSFLEVGSFQGRSSVAIGMEVKKLNSHLYCIDIWNKEMTGKEEVERLEIVKKYRTMPVTAAKYFKGDFYLIFTENIKAKGLSNTIIPITGFSSMIRKTWKNPLRFVFIDGNHDYEYVRDDCLWRQFLVNTGIIAFHDFTNSPSVRKAIDETMGNDPNFKTIGAVHSIKTFRKLK